jgi:hypothetical protein
VVVVGCVGCVGCVGGVVVVVGGWVVGGDIGSVAGEAALVDDGVDVDVGVGGGIEEEGDVGLGVVAVGEFFAGGVVVVAPDAAGDVAVTDVDDDLPSDRTANHSFSTPWPRTCPFFVSLTNV